MKKYGLLRLGILVALPLALTAINIARNGPGTPDGRTPDQIPRVAANAAGPKDVARLKKADVMQLFYALPGPAELDGEYRTLLVDVGIHSAGSAWFTPNLFGAFANRRLRIPAPRLRSAQRRPGREHA